jgi:hypothetical protein
VADRDPLDDLRERLDETKSAAQRLMGEVPPQGWRSPEEHDETVREVQALAGILHALRDVVPPELWEQIREVIRQLLLLARALIDWWVERIESSGAPRGVAPEVQDIPID